MHLFSVAGAAAQLNPALHGGRGRLSHSRRRKNLHCSLRMQPFPPVLVPARGGGVGVDATIRPLHMSKKLVLSGKIRRANLIPEMQFLKEKWIHLDSFRSLWVLLPNQRKIVFTIQPALQWRDQIRRGAHGFPLWMRGKHLV